MLATGGTACDAIQSLKELGVKNGILIGGIVRKGAFVLPTGSTELAVGDKVIVVTSIKNITDLSQILR